MGLLQVSSEISNEITTSSSTLMSSAPRFGDISTCNLDGLHRENAGPRKSDTIEFQRQYALEILNCPDDSSRFKHSIDGAVDLHGLKIDSNDKSRFFSLKMGHDIPIPASRVVGFESSCCGCITSESDKILSFAASDRFIEKSSGSHGSQVRKRLLSPLNLMLGSNEFEGDVLDLASADEKIHSSVSTSKASALVLQDCKKANVGNNIFMDPRIHSISSYSDLVNMIDDNGTLSSFTDGPVLDSLKTVSILRQSSSERKNSCKESNHHVRRSTSCMPISSKKVNSPPLSLSPLGPKWSERMKTAEYQKGLSRQYGTSCPKETPGPGDDQYKMRIDSFEGARFVQSCMDPFTPQGSPNTAYDWGLDPAPMPHCLKLVRNLNPLPVRRSLVGSFEESLLSGRLTATGLSQKIDGFLAVLNITGGDFSPPSQKLPFSVISVDGDNYLLYYASIDLAGNLPSNKYKGQKLRRSLTNDDSRSSKSRLRIPMKGRIQLVLSNPEMTPVHTFFCCYDLSDMPFGTKTFMRQKVTLVACNSAKERMKGPHTTNAASTASLLKTIQQPDINGLSSAASGEIEYSHGRRSTDQSFQCSGNDVSDFPSYTWNGNSQHLNENVGYLDTANEVQNAGKVGSAFFSNKHQNRPSYGCNAGLNDRNNERFGSSKRCDIATDERHIVDTCDMKGIKSVHSCMKVNDNPSANGALRYALHVRFLCASHKKCLKSIRRCKSDPFSAPQDDLDMNGERRFYLYNDLRVVFPQRHSDADEGKLLVEHHFPLDPKYFDISN